jgi:hypothetical protein
LTGLDGFLSGLQRQDTESALLKENFSACDVFADAIFGAGWLVISESEERPKSTGGQESRTEKDY